MSELGQFLSGFDPVPGELVLPERISGAYEPESCLSRKGEKMVLRLHRRADGVLFVLKIVPEGQEDLEEEHRILSRLEPLMPGKVPAPGDFFRENGMEYLLRTYLPGETLARYREREGSCSEETCMQLGRKLCALLTTLHSMEPPVIHRDIKPENIMLLPDGEVGLIDFGIARQYKSGKDTDTRRMGTRSTAAPEQYGYAQSDCRTDIYALGMTLLWLLTGSYDRERLADAPEIPAPLRRALEKAVAFAPENRYQSAGEFASALSGHRFRPGRRPLVWAAALLCILGVSLGALSLERSAGDAASGSTTEDVGAAPADSTAEGPALEAESQPPVVEFASASMEAAVRQALNQPEGEVRSDELAQIQRLAVVGPTAFGPEQAFDYRVGCYIDNQYQADQPMGDITDRDLELLAQMPNLEELYLCRQQIRDIAVLAELPLTTLALCENDILDVSPLAALTDLETLYLGGNPATDYSPLAGLSRLRLLVVEGCGSDGVLAVESLSFLEDLNLWQLGLGLAVPKDGDWQPLTKQVALETLELWDPPEEAVAAANTLTGLKTLSLSDYFQPDLTAISGLESLEVLNIHKGSLENLDGIGVMGRLITLSVGFNGVTDLAPLVGLDRLNYIQLESLAIPDFSPLAELPSLGYVVVNAEQAAQVEADCPGHGFELRTS